MIRLFLHDKVGNTITPLLLASTSTSYFALDMLMNLERLHWLISFLRLSSAFSNVAAGGARDRALLLTCGKDLHHHPGMIPSRMRATALPIALPRIPRFTSVHRHRAKSYYYVCVVHWYM